MNRGRLTHYQKIVPALKQLGVELIEQPFPAKADEVLETLDHPIPVCADESCHTTGDLPRLTNRYEVVNVKLDKTGGLTEALRLCERARDSGFKLLIGCMVCTSLGIAPARLLRASRTGSISTDHYSSPAIVIIRCHTRTEELEFRRANCGVEIPRRKHLIDFISNSRARGFTTSSKDRYGVRKVLPV